MADERIIFMSTKLTREIYIYIYKLIGKILIDAKQSMRAAAVYSPTSAVYSRACFPVQFQVGALTFLCIGACSSRYYQWHVVRALRILCAPGAPRGSPPPSLLSSVYILYIGYYGLLLQSSIIRTKTEKEAEKKGRCCWRQAGRKR